MENKEIDWEQRRYEIAKDLYVKNDWESRDCVRFANDLIEELKKFNENK